VKTLSLALLLMASMAFVLLGCSDREDSVLSPPDAPSLSPAAELTATGLGKSGPVLNSVSGNLHHFFGIADGTGKRRWDCFSNVSVSAKLDQDHIASGSIRSRYIGTPPEGYFPPFSGRIIQLMVEDNPGVGRMAKVMFEITEGAELFPPEYGPTPVGVVVVIDGGEGKKALPDCTVVWWAIDSPEVIEAIGLYGMSPLEYAQLIQSMLPPEVPLYSPVDNGNIQVR